MSEIPTRTEEPGIAADARPPAAALRPLADEMDDTLIWSVVDAAPDGLIMADESGQIVLVNRQTEALFGADRGELLGRVDELLPERFRAAHRAHRTRYRVEPQPRAMGVGVRLFARRVDGTEFPVEVSLSPVHTAQGLRIIAAVRDISERVAAEAREREIREILDATQDAVSILDAATLRFTYVNRGLADQVGYEPDDLLAMGMLHIAPEFTEASLRELLAPFEEGAVTSITFRTTHRRRDGSDLPVEILMQGIADGAAPPRAYVKIARDISERLAAEGRQRRAEQELRLVEDRERLARDLHDFVIQRLFASGMAAQSLQARIADEQLSARAGQIVDELDETIREIRTVIFGLSSADRDQQGLRQRILGVIEDERDALGVAPNVAFDGVIDDVDDGVAHEVLAVLREALSNVARHARADKIEVLVASDGEQITLRVIDDGIGFDITSPDAGNGLGNMEERARSMGGTFTTTSAPGAGTITECRIPRFPATR